MLLFHINKHFPFVWLLISTLMARNSFIGGRKRHLRVEFTSSVFHVEYFCICWLYVSCNIVVFSEQEEFSIPILLQLWNEEINSICIFFFKYSCCITKLLNNCSDSFRPLWDLHPAPKLIYSLDWLLDPRCCIIFIE
jgi:hypothetical protein